MPPKDRCAIFVVHAPTCVHCRQRADLCYGFQATTKMVSIPYDSISSFTVTGSITTNHRIPRAPYQQKLITTISAFRQSIYSIRIELLRIH